MKTLLTVACLLGLAGPALAADDPAGLTNDTDKASYSIGANIGRSFKTQSIELNTNAFLQGFRDAYTGSKLQLTDEESQQALDAFKKVVAAKQEAAAKALGDKNKKEGEQFLVENAKKEGIKTLASGLQYKVVKTGDGKKPTADDYVKVHYRGTLINGTEFDSSYKRNEPTTFQLGQIIPGWREALQLMPVGSKWQLFVPSALAYGEEAPPDIGPNATLLFEVELLSIEPKPKEDPAAGLKLQ
jgi:FKBP-type peptidyl-prolyl cis-trans isomerase FklB